MNGWQKGIPNKPGAYWVSHGKLISIIRVVAGNFGEEKLVCYSLGTDYRHPLSEIVIDYFQEATAPIPPT